MQRNVSKPELYHPQGTALCASILTQWMGSFRYFGDSLWSISSVDRTAQWPVGKLVPDTAIDYWQVSRKIYQHIPPSLLLAPVDNPPFGPMTVWTTDKHLSQNVLRQMAVPQPLFEKLYARDAECKFASLSMVGTARTHYKKISWHHARISGHQWNFRTFRTNFEISGISGQRRTPRPETNKW